MTKSSESRDNHAFIEGVLYWWKVHCSKFPAACAKAGESSSPSHLPRRLLHAQVHVRRSGNYRVCGLHPDYYHAPQQQTQSRLSSVARSLVRGACVWRLWTDCSAAAVVWSCDRGGHIHAHTPFAHSLQRADVVAGGCIRIGMQSAERVAPAARAGIVVGVSSSVVRVAHLLTYS